VLTLLLLLSAGCGRDEPAGPPEVRLQAGGQDVAVRPVQYCQEGEGRRYDTRPPIVEVAPDSPVTITVPDGVAQRGWSVQVFDEKLEEMLGEVDVPEGEAVFSGINTSDVVPPAFYLVVVENKGGDCDGFSGAWPMGLLRAGGDVAGTPTASGTPTP
jgi:hypothetical protein